MNEQLTQIYGYLHGMWRYRWSALVVTWFVAILGWPLVFSLPDQFSAKAVVYVDTSSVLKPLLKGLAPETDSRDELQVMTRVLLSRENLMTVVRETDMDLEVNSTAQQEALVEGLAGAITITGGGSGKRGEKASNVYEIAFQSDSANRAYQVVSKLLNTMIEDTLNSTRTDTVTAQKFLDTQIAEYEERLSIAEQKLANFKKENVGFMPDERGGYYMRLQRSKDAVEEIMSALRLAERRYSELTRQLKDENLMSTVSGLSANAIKIQKYQEELDYLLNQYTDEHPDVKAVKAIIDDLKKNPVTGIGSTAISGDTEQQALNPIYQEVKVEQSKASVELETLKIKLSEQQAYVKKLQESIDVIPEVEAKLAKLNRGYEVTRERYLDLVERRESAGLAQSAEQSSSDITFRVIEPPIVPYKPSGPNRALFLSLVLVIAMGAGLAWSFLRFILQPTYFSLTQLSETTGLPTLGSVSLYLTPEHKQNRRIQLTFFVSAVLILVFMFGAVFVFRSTGTSLVSFMLAGI